MTAADQSRSLAPRDGLAGSDEVEAALSTVDWSLIGEPNGATMASAREAAVHVAVTVAARVRAEAVAEERQRIADAETLRDLAPADDITCDTLCEIADRLERSAGSVPVATPPAAQRTQESDVRGTARGTGAYSVGTGTPAEEVSGGSGHAERQECHPGCDCMGPQERAAARIVDLEQDRERLTAEVARLTAERLEFKRSVTTVVGMRETTRRERDAALAEVASYRTAIEQAVRTLDRIAAEPPRSERLRAISVALAAAVGDGA